PSGSIDHAIASVPCLPVEITQIEQASSLIGQSVFRDTATAGLVRRRINLNLGVSMRQFSIGCVKQS
ncbi:MAG: hypothetical protein ACPHYH_04465, partial [Flavobacteriaceae bacterium]